MIGLDGGCYLTVNHGMKILVVLTQWKRSNLELQLDSIYKQTVIPDYVVVFQNEHHVGDITHLKNKFNFIHIRSDYNTKYFGRFAACFTFPVDICIVMDDDIVPARDCIRTYVNECVRLNAIIGGNGRNATSNPCIGSLKEPSDVGLRSESVLVDFVGHLWCFKKEWLYYMFAIQPHTYDTGEDMHLCFSAKILGGIKSFVGKQAVHDELSDTSMNRFADDQHASYRNTALKHRVDVELMFKNKYNIQFITSN